jgi:outer membrane scaffolding protein for murein synthesis (MipA/OmpV family)
MKEKKATSIKGLSTLLVLKNLVLLGILMITVPVQVFPSEKPWEFSLGAGVYTSNAYYGSKEMYASPFPDIKVSYTKGNFSSSVSFLDGIGITYVNPENHFLAGININNGEERDSEEYTGLGVSKDHSDKVKKLLEGTPDVSTDIKTELMLGYMSKFGIFGVSLEYHPTTQKMPGKREQIYDGFISSLSYTKPVSVTNKLTVTTKLAVDLMDKNYAKAWYLVEKPTQALNAFEADAGLRDVQLAVRIDYKFSVHISATFLAQNSFLLMDAGDSPYTTARYQLTSGLYGIYTF